MARTYVSVGCKRRGVEGGAPDAVVGWGLDWRARTYVDWFVVVVVVVVVGILLTYERSAACLITD